MSLLSAWPEPRAWEGGSEAEGLGCRVRLAFTFADLLVVCSFLFTCRTWFGAQVNLVSGTEPFRDAGGLDNVSTCWLLPTPFLPVAGAPPRVLGADGPLSTSGK